jgi:DNA-directed RNA polymerase I subunit RPA49
VTPAEYKTIPSAPLLQLKKKEDWAQMREQNIYPAYVMERLEVSVRAKDERRVKALLYLSYLIRFRNASESALNRIDALNDTLVSASANVQHRLFELFTEAHETTGAGGAPTMRYKMPPQLKDKLTAYICALCLHIDAFSVVPTTLAQDLHVTTTKMLDAFRQLGCAVETASVNGESCRRARLKAPVVFPKPPRKRMNR